jgi:hypothetical protein
MYAKPLTVVMLVCRSTATCGGLPSSLTACGCPTSLHPWAELRAWWSSRPSSHTGKHGSLDCLTETLKKTNSKKKIRKIHEVGCKSWRNDWSLTICEFAAVGSDAETLT